MKLQSFLFKPIDHAQVTIWRILFGLVLFFECMGSNVVGWTNEVFVSPPKFTFNFIGLDWLQPLPGSGMYYYFGVMGLIGIAITIGWRYRLFMPLFTIGWAGLYFMHKTSYNNHHYLMLLLCILMCFTPANANLSLDAKQGRTKRRSTIPNIFRWQFLALFLIVYTYASVAKCYPDWMDGTVSKIMFSSKTDIPLIGPMYAWPATPMIIAWGGILYDLLVIPALLWKPTRKFAFTISVVFHIFNSVTFQIGTFPYMMIAASVLFFPPVTIRKIFRIKDRPDEVNTPPYSYKVQKVLTSIFIGFMSIQILLPLRHFAIPGNVFYTEEGHRLSWRMMLRVKSGTIGFRVIQGDQIIQHNVRNDLTRYQFHSLTTHPDMIWQYCQHLKKTYGENIEIYVNAWVSVNNRKHQQIIDPEYDMAKAKWHIFGHEEWILLCDWENDAER